MFFSPVLQMRKLRPLSFSSKIAKLGSNGNWDGAGAGGLFYHRNRVALQRCADFRCTTKGATCTCTYLPSLGSLPPPPLSVISEHRAGPVHYRPFSAAGRLTPDSACAGARLSIHPRPLPPLCPQVRPVHLRLQSFPDGLTRTISLDSIYMCVCVKYTIFVFSS